MPRSWSAPRRTRRPGARTTTPTRAGPRGTRGRGRRPPAARPAPATTRPRALAPTAQPVADGVAASPTSGRPTAPTTPAPQVSRLRRPRQAPPSASQRMVRAGLPPQMPPTTRICTSLSLARRRPPPDTPADRAPTPGFSPRPGPKESFPERHHTNAVHNAGGRVVESATDSSLGLHSHSLLLPTIAPALRWQRDLGCSGPLADFLWWRGLSGLLWRLSQCSWSRRTRLGEGPLTAS